MLHDAGSQEEGGGLQEILVSVKGWMLKSLLYVAFIRAIFL